MPVRRILKKSRKLARRILKGRPGESGSAPLILNEAVNFDKQVIFIAIPKTGTTTVRDQLRQEGDALIPNPHLNIIQVRDAIYAYLLKISLGNNYGFPTKDVPSDADIRARANEIFDSFFKFSAVRNPWARAVSLYARRETVQMRNKLSFEAFCERHFYASDTCRHPTLHKNQLDWLCDETGKCIMDYVYKLEDFTTAMEQIADRTDGRVRLTYRKLNANPSSPSRRYRELYSERARKIVSERFQKDIDFFKYTF